MKKILVWLKQPASEIEIFIFYLGLGSPLWLILWGILFNKPASSGW